MPLKYTINKTNEFMQWLFHKGTRVIELLNSTLLIGFTLTFLYNFSDLIALPTFKGFGIATSAWWWVSMGTLGVIQLMAMIKKSLQSNQFSGYVLLVSAWVWALVCATFIYGLPPLTTAPITYGIVSILCAMAGTYLIKCNKALEDEENNKELIQEVANVGVARKEG